MAQPMTICDPDAESALIGSILIDHARVMYECAKHEITPMSFGSPDAKRAFDAAISARQKHGAVDPVLICADIAPTDPLRAYIDHCCDNVTTAGHAGHYAKIVKGHERTRALIDAIQAAESNARKSPADCSEAIANLQTQVTAITASNAIKIHGVADYAEEKLDQWRQAKDRGYVGVPSSISDLNRYLGGWRKGTMGIIGAYRGHCQSANPGHGHNRQQRNQDPRRCRLR